MSNYHVEAVDKPAALTSEALKSLRHQQVQGLSRRQLIRRSLGAGVALWLLEISAGTIGFIWPNLASGFGGKLPIGTLEEVKIGQLRRCRSSRASRPTSRSRARSSSSSTRPSSGSSPARTRPVTARPSTSGRCTSAARTWVASRTRA